MKKILIVDNEEAVCEALKIFLTRKKYQATAVLNGKEALEKVEQERPDIVLLDVRMPGIGGLETLKEIKRMDKKIRVVLITAVVNDNLKEKSKELGADGYISKPFDLKTLAAFLAKL